VKQHRGVIIFLLMQVFFVVLGFSLFFGLRALKESRDAAQTPAPGQSQQAH